MIPWSIFYRNILRFEVANGVNSGYPDKRKMFRYSKERYADVCIHAAVHRHVRRRSGALVLRVHRQAHEGGQFARALTLTSASSPRAGIGSRLGSRRVGLDQGPPGVPGACRLRRRVLRSGEPPGDHLPLRRRAAGRGRDRLYSWRVDDQGHHQAVYRSRHLPASGRGPLRVDTHRGRGRYPVDRAIGA